MDFQLPIKTKMLNIKILLAFKISHAVFILLINVKMPTIVGILTFMSRIKGYVHLGAILAPYRAKN